MIKEQKSSLCELRAAIWTSEATLGVASRTRDRRHIWFVFAQCFVKVSKNVNAKQSTWFGWSNSFTFWTCYHPQVTTPFAHAQGSVQAEKILNYIHHINYIHCFIIVIVVSSVQWKFPCTSNESLKQSLLRKRNIRL